mgnify:CR=1 FL=1
MELHGFTEGLRRVFGYSVAGLGHAQQFGLAGAVLFGGGQLAGGLRVAAAEYGKTVTGDGDGFPEVAPVVVFHIIEIDGFKQGLRLRTDAPEALGEDVFLEFRDDVSGSALNLDVVVDDAAHRDDVEDGLGGLRVPVIAQGLALPVRIDLVAEEHFLLLGDRIRILRARRHRVQFFVNPVVGQFRADMDSRAVRPALPTTSSPGWMVMVLVSQWRLKALARRTIMGSPSVSLNTCVLESAPSRQTAGTWVKNCFLSWSIREVSMAGSFVDNGKNGWEFKRA